MTEPKPVKARAVVGPHGNIERNSMFVTEQGAARDLSDDDRAHGYRVIPVTITPGHEAEDAEV